MYERNSQRFRLQPDAAASDGRPPTLVDQDGETPTVGEAALVSADGSTMLRRLPSNVYFWFAWFAFHPGTDLYGAP